MAIRLPDEAANGVSEEWFNALLGRNDNNEEELAALKAYHDRQVTAEEAAYAITRPITNSPIHDVSTSYSPATNRPEGLFGIFVRALMEWPSCRTADMIALLLAISKLPGQLHQGAPEETSGEPISWSDLPCFRWVWGDFAWATPGVIVRDTARNATKREFEVKRYIKTEYVYAQLTAAGIFEIQYAYNHLIGALERNPALNDSIRFDKRVIPEMHIPGANYWIKANGKRLYEGAINREMQKWDSYDEPSMFLNYNQMDTDRWAFWMKRFEDYANDEEQNQEVMKAAETAIKHMKDVVVAWEAEKGI